MTKAGGARALMFQGTGSDVGKSLIVAGLARALTLRGLKVRPFKPQNMSNNAAVTLDGGEIGRAQALQARAAGVQPTVHMNPVLLKPQSGMGAQVVVQGKVLGSWKAADFQTLKPSLMAPVLESLDSLRAEADIVLIEGAGSASEVNLRQNDIANMGLARAADVPVVLIGDIDRGGVIASLVGTRTVLDPADAAMVCGFLVNRFRGDPALFADGMDRIAADTGWRAFGLVPHIDDARRLPAEDALALRQPGTEKGAGTLLVIAPMLPSISNFDDLDPLEAEPGVTVRRQSPDIPIPGDADLVVLPGSKATIADLRALKQSGLDIDIAAHVRRGGHVLGICGGFQMLGCCVRDEAGLEGEAGSIRGLGLLDIETSLGGDKRLVAVRGTSFSGATLSGYEMHMGQTTGAAMAQPFAHITVSAGASFPDGAVGHNGRVVGTYIHGLFSDDTQRADWIKRLGGRSGGLDYEAGVDAALDALAAHLETHLDIDAMLALAR
ncbi:cobyric acid synthase [Acuticoccus sp. MNP-M23]|uniref:cobyric acid synthase n=1 Tax=Acuticoccus sp. MNP-M23 TaxID=3072793 RepID=UPI002814E037|nr:cobyric acid synthase [Acuticoccus sp. MNP-M23]WMS43277.1 cobyric acid synthase [Acuticoccus sp. MNP-M23]